MSAFGQQFFQSVATAKEAMEKQRDNLIGDLDLVKENHEQAMDEIRAMFPAKAEEYEDIIKATDKMELQPDDSSDDINPKGRNAECIPDAQERRRAAKVAIRSEDPDCNCGADEKAHTPKGKPPVRVTPGNPKVKSLPSTPAKSPFVSASKNPTPITRKLSLKKPGTVKPESPAIRRSSMDSPSVHSSPRRSSQSGIRPPGIHATPDNRGRSSIPQSLSARRPASMPRLIPKLVLKQEVRAQGTNASTNESSPAPDDAQ